MSGDVVLRCVVQVLQRFEGVVLCCAVLGRVGFICVRLVVGYRSSWIAWRGASHNVRVASGAQRGGGGSDSGG